MGWIKTRLVIAGCGMVLIAINADAQAIEGAKATVVERSPFLPPGFSPPTSGQPAAQARNSVGGYEFRGVYQLGDTYRFLVSEPRSRSGSWVEVGGDYEGYEVRAYDPDSETLTLFFNNSENQLKLAEIESNPTPMPVSGQIQTPQPAAEKATPRPQRRTIRPTSRIQETDTSRPAPPPPAWLQKLREEAAAKRAQAGDNLPVPPSLNPSGSESGLPPPPTQPPPALPEELLNMEIPPPPDVLPPPPPPELQQKMMQSISSGYPGG